MSIPNFVAEHDAAMLVDEVSYTDGGEVIDRAWADYATAKEELDAYGLLIAAPCATPAGIGAKLAYFLEPPVDSDSWDVRAGPQPLVAFVRSLEAPLARMRVAIWEQLGLDLFKVVSRGPCVTLEVDRHHRKRSAEHPFWQRPFEGLPQCGDRARIKSIAVLSDALQQLKENGYHLLVDCSCVSEGLGGVPGQGERIVQTLHNLVVHGSAPTFGLVHQQVAEGSRQAKRYPNLVIGSHQSLIPNQTDRAVALFWCHVLTLNWCDTSLVS